MEPRDKPAGEDEGILASYRGFWILAVCVVIGWVTSLEPLPAWIASAISKHPGRNVDYLVLPVAQGLGALLGLLLIILVCALTWKHSPRWAGASLFMSWAILTPPMIRASYVLGGCLNSLDAAQTQIVLDDYLRPSFQRTTFHIGLGSAMVLALCAWSGQWFLSRRAAQNGAR